MSIVDILGKFDEVASWTASPPEDRPIAGTIGATMQTVCDSFANAPQWAKDAVAATPSGAQGIPGALGIVCRPYWNGAGVDGPRLTVPFTGGQCEGVSYLVRGTFSWSGGVFCSDGSPITPGDTRQTSDIFGTSFTVTGPVSSASATAVAPTCQGGGTRIQLEVVAANGTFQSFFDSGNVRTYEGVSSAFNFPRSDSGEECGDPPAELEPGDNPPPDPGPLPADVTPVFDPDNPFGAPIGFPDIPNLPGFDPFPIPPDAGLGGDGAGRPGGDDGLPGLPDAAAEEAGSVNGGEDGEDVEFGDPPEGRIWVGCVVTATVDSRLGNIAGTAPQSTVYPQVVGNVALKHGDFYSASVPIRSKFQDMFRKNSCLIVTGCFIHARPGASLSVRPISTVTCPENPCEED